MGHNVYYVLNLKGLRDELEHYGVNGFRRIYSKYDSILGDSECVEFVLEILRDTESDMKKARKK
jgi:hypothetical protein